MVSRLVHTKKGKAVEDAGMHLLSTIGNDAHNNLRMEMSRMNFKGSLCNKPFSRRLGPRYANLCGSTDVKCFASRRTKFYRIKPHLPVDS